jgi:ABC-type uncharacterized transport system substrate-binding protein
MKRRNLIAMLGGAAVACPVGLALAAADTTAQSPSGAPRIGFLATLARPEWADAFRRGLSDLGYVENRTIIIDWRSAAGQAGRLPALAAELVRLQMRVIVASSPPAALAAKKVTTTIPIVMAFANDPVALGLVASLAHPGGNVTGLSNQATGLMGKRLEMLAEIVPGLSSVGVVWDPTDKSNLANFRELQAAAIILRLALDSFEVRRPDDFGAAFKAAALRAGGVAVLNSALVGGHRGIVVAAAAQHNVPAIDFGTEYAAAGGHISYGPNIADMHRRAALFVDKILKGAKPADLPVEQPTKFELVVNLRTAKALGLAIPQSVLVRADDVIE